jgi:hypothetical protein
MREILAWTLRWCFWCAALLALAWLLRPLILRADDPVHPPIQSIDAPGARR